MHSPLILITGIMAAGKSTVAQALAERLPKSVHLRGDIFRRMIVSGREDMTPNASAEALAQLSLRYELAAATAQRYLAAGFSVVYQDVIIGPMLNGVMGLLTDVDLHVVVLCPNAEVVTEREATRPKIGYTSFTPADLNQVLWQETPRVGWWLDTSTMTVGETVEQILENLEKARIS